MNKFTKILLSLSLAVIPAVANANCDSGELVIRFSHQNRPVDHPIGDAAAKLESRINSEMDGRACMEVFSNSILYTDETVIGALLSGDIQMAAPSFGKVGRYTKQLRLFSMPFMFKNLAAVEDFQGSLTGELLKHALIGKGVLGLGFWHNGMNQFTANKPLLWPKDIENLKVRYDGSAVSFESITTMGGVPEALSFSETFGALEDGSIDATEDTWTNIYNKKFHTVQNGITETNHSVGGSLVVVLNSWFKSLPTDVAVDFSRIVKEVTAEQQANVMRDTEEAKQRILDEGGVVRTLSSSRREEWAENAKGTWTKFDKEVHPLLIELVREINARH